jgi:L-fuculose-phosphate aldolase
VPDTHVLFQARRVCGEIGFAPYALPGSEALGRNIAQSFAAGFDCAVLENHGVVTGGLHLHHAFQRFETLEFAAKTIIKANLLGKVRYLAREDLFQARDPDQALMFQPGPARPVEKELRRQLCAFVRRSYQQRLMISTEGAFSARLDADSFVITPRGIDRQTLKVEDIVLVYRGVAEAGQVPSRAWRNHQAIYEAHPEIQAVVNAYPVNATAFSVTAAPLDTRTIPESYLFLREVNLAPSGLQFRDGRELAALTSLRHPAILLPNDGVQVCGTSVLDAFDRLEVLESTAEAMINSRPLGAMVPMSDEAIRELVGAFLKGE